MKNLESSVQREQTSLYSGFTIKMKEHNLGCSLFADDVGAHAEAFS
jgi:hypothetical protein